MPLGTYTLPSQVIAKLVEMAVPLEFHYNPDGDIYEDSFYCFCEQHPFWVPYEANEYFDFGDRVINIRSGDRRYIPFGLFGTVIGYNDDHVVVLFDEPLFLGFELSSMAEHKTYRIVQVEKTRLINYSR